MFLGILGKFRGILEGFRGVSRDLKVTHGGSGESEGCFTASDGS